MGKEDRPSSGARHAGVMKAGPTTHNSVSIRTAITNQSVIKTAFLLYDVSPDGIAAA